MFLLIRDGRNIEGRMFPKPDNRPDNKKRLSISSFYTGNVLQHEKRYQSIHLSRFDLFYWLSSVFTFYRKKGYRIKLSLNKVTNQTHIHKISNNPQTFVSITEYRKSNTPNLFVHTEYWSQTAAFSSGKLLNARLLKTKNPTEQESVFR